MVQIPGRTVVLQEVDATNRGQYNYVIGSVLHPEWKYYSEIVTLSPQAIE